MQVGSASLALDGSDSCGDQVGHWVDGPFATLCVVDGLGHGPAAEHAAKVVLGFVRENLGMPLEAVFAGADEAARATRGAAMGLVRLNLQEKLLSYAGVGNTRARLLAKSGRAIRSLSNCNGIVGAGYQRLVPETVSFAPDDLLILFTDGIPAGFDASGFFGYRRPVEEVAKGVLREFSLGTDDAAVLVARMENDE